MNREEKQFNDLIYQYYGQKDMFDKIKHNFWAVRTKLLIHDSFRNSFIKKQFEMCTTVINIANHTSLESLRQFSIRKDKTETFEYSINFGYQEPIKINLQSADVFDADLIKKQILLTI